MRYVLVGFDRPAPWLEVFRLGVVQRVVGVAGEPYRIAAPRTAPARAGVMADDQTIYKRSVYNIVDGEKVWSTAVYVVDQEKHDRRGPFEFGAGYADGSLNAVIDSLIAIRGSIPVEYRERARCDIGSTSGYDGEHYAHIKVLYFRPETADETAEREVSVTPPPRRHISN